MKLLSTLTIFCYLAIYSNATDTTIVFNQIQYRDVFELAKKEQKSVFLFFHFDGCGACVKMEKTVFTDRNVADFYNSNFVNFEINTREGEGIETNKIYNIQMHPTCLYLDSDGNILHKIVGAFSPEEFILHGLDALDPNKTLYAYKELYQKGNRNPGFLLDYCYKLRDAYELDSALIREYINTQSLENLEKEENIRFVYEFAIHEWKYIMPFGSREFKFLNKNKNKFYNFFDPEQVDARIVFITYEAIFDAIENKDSVLFNKCLSFLKEYDRGKVYPFKLMDGRTIGIITSKNLVLTANMAYYEKTGETKKYNETLRLYINKIWDDWRDLNSMAWNTYESSDDKDRLKSAKEWVIRSIELNPNYYNIDTYAALLFKLEEFENALVQADKAISIAKNTGRDYQSTSELIEKIREKINPK